MKTGVSKWAVAMWLSLLAAVSAAAAMVQSAAATPAAADAVPPVLDPLLRQAEKRVLKALARKREWDGPTTGPVAQAPGTIAFIAADMRNAGVTGVWQGVREATAAIGWAVRLCDGTGSTKDRSIQLNSALAARPAGIVLGGFDAKEHADILGRAKALGVPIVGWHAAAKSGPADGLFTNITTGPLEVAEVSAMFVIAMSGGRARAVVFTDSNFAIATAKSERMVATLRRCRQCEVLAVEDAALATLSERMPAIASALLSQHGARWTHSLAINDLYFDRLAETLTARGADPARLVNISAGDGSVSAYQRIRVGHWQSATVPEPLNLHGWQCVDEINRARAGEPPSGYSSPVHFATISTIVFDGGRNNQFDPDNGYRAAYRKVWGR